MNERRIRFVIVCIHLKTEHFLFFVVCFIFDELAEKVFPSPESHTYYLLQQNFFMMKENDASDMHQFVKCRKQRGDSSVASAAPALCR